MADVVKDIGEIWGRLFDHRPFLNGEIKLFLHEFEVRKLSGEEGQEKRGNKEVDTLFEILQNLTEINCSQIDKIKFGAEAHFLPLKRNIDDCVIICERILEKEEVNKSDETVLKKKQLRTYEWENFIQEIAKKCEKVDKAFKEKEDDLNDYYLNLEKKLCISFKNISTIKDPTIFLKSSDKLLKFLEEKLATQTGNFPENIRCLIESKEALLKASDIEWMNKFLESQRETDNNQLLRGKELYDELDKLIACKYFGFDFDCFLNEKNKDETYLHELLKGSDLILPENERIRRNPFLAERIERLKKEQQEREYKEMTKNIDMSKKLVVEDTIAYQMNMMNRHLIAVAQFVLSVGAGFAFGFLGIEWIIGDLNFGLRLLLGIACALVIATAEFYFLAKHLSEEEKQEARGKEMFRQKLVTKSFKEKSKLHKD